jgi:hypothetical protein
MSKIKSPTEKKRLAYEREYFSGGEYPKQFRKGWPRKEARASRALRRTVHQVLASANRVGPNFATDIDVSGIRRKRVRKWGAETLGHRVARKQERRRRSVGAKAARARFRVWMTKRIEAMQKSGAQRRQWQSFDYDSKA